MPRINLLAWRDELRSHRRRQFFMALGAATAAAGLVILVANLVFSSVISYQQSRNNLLQQEIDNLDRRIEEILGLEDQKQRLLARMEIIEQLQRSRPGIVHVFEELVETLPDGVYLTGVSQIGKKLEIDGSAESNTRVSAFMRNIDDSEWLGDPDLEVVEVKDESRGQGSRRASEFTVFADQLNDEDAEEGAE